MGKEIDTLKERAASAATSRDRLAAYKTMLKLKNRGKKTDDTTDDGDDVDSKDQKQDAEDRLSGEQDWASKGKTTKDKETRQRYLRRYYLWLKPYRFTLISLVVSGLVVSALEVFIPIIIGQMVDAVTGESRVVAQSSYLQAMSLNGLLIFFTLIGLVTIILGKLFNFWRNYQTNVVNAQVTHRLRAQLHDRILHLPLSDLHDLKTGGVVSRLSGDIDGTIGLVQQAVLSPIQAVLRLLFVSGYLMYLSWQVTTVSLAILSVMAMVYYIMMKRVRPIYRGMGEDRQRIDANLTETFGGIRVVRTFAREHLQYGVGHHTVIRKQIWVRLVQGFLFLFWEMLMPLTSLLIVAMGCWLIASGHNNFTLGDIFQLLMLTFMVLNPVFMLVQSITETQRSLASMERVYEILERPTEKPDRTVNKPLCREIESIELNHVDFAYGYDDQEDIQIADADYVLKDINLHIPGGSVVAFVGPSGAGKTTLTDLLARFHDPVSGSILLNGIDIRDYKLADYRTLLGVVQQEVFLFDGTIRENIAYGLRETTDAAVEEAARRANALEFIDKLDDRFGSIIGERGVKLSGGQRQRLSVARAILADPRLLILDEATSNLDTESEQLIQASLTELFKNRTTFVVAHRLSTIRNADIIVVVDDGKIIQQGDHQQLMSAGVGTDYYDMVKRQENLD
ncbi:MAG: ABC transporter ATP-binding protein [Planctomycetes bacterium]|nr:ABC transporter ATP-binding protein [Planctomycetota bacterium]